MICDFGKAEYFCGRGLTGVGDLPEGSKSSAAKLRIIVHWPPPASVAERKAEDLFMGLLARLGHGGWTLCASELALDVNHRPSFRIGL